MEVGDEGRGSELASSKDLRVSEHSCVLGGLTPKGPLMLRSADSQLHPPPPQLHVGVPGGKRNPRTALPSP